MHGYVFHGISGQSHGQTLKIAWHLLSDICTDTHLRASCGKGSSREFYWDLDGKNTELGMSSSLHRKQGLFLSVFVDDFQTVGKEAENGSHGEEIDEKR